MDVLTLALGLASRVVRSRARVARLAERCRRENRVTLEDLVVGSFGPDSDAPSSRAESAPPGSLVATLEELILGLPFRSSKTGGEE